MVMSVTKTFVGLAVFLAQFQHGDVETSVLALRFRDTTPLLESEKEYSKNYASPQQEYDANYAPSVARKVHEDIMTNLFPKSVASRRFLSNGSSPGKSWSGSFKHSVQYYQKLVRKLGGFLGGENPDTVNEVIEKKLEFLTQMVKNVDHLENIYSEENLIGMVAHLRGLGNPEEVIFKTMGKWGNPAEAKDVWSVLKGEGAPNNSGPVAIYTNIASLLAAHYLVKTDSIGKSDEVKKVLQKLANLDGEQQTEAAKVLDTLSEETKDHLKKNNYITFVWALGKLQAVGKGDKSQDADIMNRMANQGQFQINLSNGEFVKDVNYMIPFLS